MNRDALPLPFRSKHRPSVEAAAVGFDRVNEFLVNFAGFTPIQLHFVHEAIDRAGVRLIPVKADNLNWIEIKRLLDRYFNNEPGYPKPCGSPLCRDTKFADCIQCQTWSACEERHERAWLLYVTLCDESPRTNTSIQGTRIPGTEEELAAEFARLLDVPIDSIVNDAAHLQNAI